MKNYNEIENYLRDNNATIRFTDKRVEVTYHIDSIIKSRTGVYF